jgi:hypothetical protein
MRDETSTAYRGVKLSLATSYRVVPLTYLGDGTNPQRRLRSAQHLSIEVQDAFQSHSTLPQPDESI